LYRRRAQSHQAAVAAGRIAIQVEQDRNAVGADATEDLFVRLRADVGEMLEGAGGAPTYRPGIGGPQAVAEGLETRAIDPLPMLELQVHHRMLAQVGRDEADAKPRARRHRRSGAGCRRWWGLGCGPALRRAQLGSRVAWHRQQRKRIDRVASIA